MCLLKQEHGQFWDWNRVKKKQECGYPGGSFEGWL